MSNSIGLHRNNGGLNTFDSFDKMFAPLFQHSVGFDRLFDSMNKALSESTQHGGYPPYDIVQTGDDDYTITVAVAGFSAGEIEVKLDKGILSIVGDKATDKAAKEVKYLHRGIANRKFCHRFRLTDYIRVLDASLADGMLTISLLRELPEALKPRVIDITSN